MDRDQLKIIMDSGVIYNINTDIDVFLGLIHNGMGVVINQLITLGTDKKILINPYHISSIELI